MSMKLGNILRASIVALGLLGGADASRAQAVKTPQAGEGSAYALIGTEVWDVPDPVSGRGYQVYVSVPPSYEKQPQRRYPVLFVTDAGYYFPVVRVLRSLLNSDGDQVEPFILVGLSYAKGEEPKLSRNRDYTPTPNGPSDGPGAADVLGGGPAYQAYLRDQVKPFIAQRYRTDPKRTFLMGHSYGGLLGAQILFADPTLFSGYILGSPSLWYDKRHIFEREAAYAASHRDLPAKVYMYVGEYESLRKGDLRYNQTVDMVGNNRALDSILKTRAYRSLILKSEVLNDEEHTSVATRGIIHGLKFLLPADKPVTSQGTGP
jgi:predicted alpha/beta superfamily hydrolase